MDPRGASGLLALLVALIAATAITGCGGSSSASTDTTRTVTETATVSTVDTASAEDDSRSAGVREIASNLQLDLERSGFEPGFASGEFTPALGAGLRRFQEAHHIAAAERGALGPDTASALGSSDAVSALQSALTDVGLFSSTINGTYDAATLTAVRALQKQARIGQDGFYGAQSAAALQKLDVRVAPEPVDDALVTPAEGASFSSSVTLTGTETTGSLVGWPDPGLLKLGSRGEAVKTLQLRLARLGYRPGPADGTFGAATAGAVLAFQKRAGLPRDSVVGPAVQAELAISGGGGPGPRAGPVPRIDVDIARQLVFVVLKGGSLITLNSSTGNGETYAVPGGGSDVAYTPVGDFTVIRKVPGDEHAPLGTLRNPLYFYRGWAIHGAANVPAYPASHGCARISNADADWLFPQISLGTPVIVYDTTGESHRSSNLAPALNPSSNSATQTQLTAALKYPSFVTSMNGYGYQCAIAPRISVNASQHTGKISESHTVRTATRPRGPAASQPTTAMIGTTV
jgi:peptidoglycan hydrolase-like protein with peptidoglycan-binding domain